MAREARAEVKDLMDLLEQPDDNIAVANGIREYLVKAQTPREVRLDLAQNMTELVASEFTADANAYAAGSLIDAIRGERDPDVRVRMIAMASHKLQQEYYSEASLRDIDRKELMDIVTFYQTFEMLSSDEEADPAHRAWARFLLEPRGVTEVLNRLYDQDGWEPIDLRVQEEITELTDGLSSTGKESEGDLSFTGRIARLPEACFPTLEKIDLYEEKMKRPLPIFLSRVEGAKKLVSIEFPLDLTRQVSEVLKKYRAGTATRQEVFKARKDAATEYMTRLSEEQRAELDGANVELRFGTEVSKRPEITVIQDEDEAAASA